MRKYIVIIFALMLGALGVNAQTSLPMGELSGTYTMMNKINYQLKNQFGCDSLVSYNDSYSVDAIVRLLDKKRNYSNGIGIGGSFQKSLGILDTVGLERKSWSVGINYSHRANLIEMGYFNSRQELANGQMLSDTSYMESFYKEVKSAGLYIKARAAYSTNLQLHNHVWFDRALVSLFPKMYVEGRFARQNYPWGKILTRYEGDTILPRLNNQDSARINFSLKIGVRPISIQLGRKGKVALSWDNELVLNKYDFFNERRNVYFKTGLTLNSTSVIADVVKVNFITQLGYSPDATNYNIGGEVTVDVVNLLGIIFPNFIKF